MRDSLAQALEEIYGALHANNEGLDEHIARLRAAMADAGLKQVEMEPARLPQNNRQGRKMLQTYFKKRGVAVAYRAA